MFDLHHPPWNPGYKSPLYFVEGMRVFIPIPRTPEHVAEGKTYCCPAIVSVAAGTTARVINEKHHIAQWVEREDCAIPEDEYDKQLNVNRMVLTMHNSHLSKAVPAGG